jgi:hypothetical protein
LHAIIWSDDLGILTLKLPGPKRLGWC